MSSTDSTSYILIQYIKIDQVDHFPKKVGILALYSQLTETSDSGIHQVGG